MVFPRRSATLKYFTALIFGVIWYNETFVYIMQPYFWHKLECPNDNTSCVKIMFIADPQIQGEMAVAPPLSYLINWDSDKYLRSTFVVAMKNFRPNVLVYLGDLMDEGSKATKDQFYVYVRRLSRIFEFSNYLEVPQIFLPGDNDIGGENEPVRKDKLRDFEEVYNQPDIITFKNITFFKVNGITYTYPHSTGDYKYKIVVSHYPLLKKPVFGKQVNDAIQPNVYFCAHEHKSKLFVKDKDWSNILARAITPDDDVLNVGNDGGMKYEIYVPTCSYRMGTQSIGYGAAIVENNRLTRYTVLWSPRRFLYLISYAVLLIISIIYFSVFGLSRLFHKFFPAQSVDAMVPLVKITSQG